MARRKYRSKYEKGIGDAAPREVKYEVSKLQWIPPKRVYTVDWTLPNGIMVESKGRFVASDRTKMKCIKEQYPMLDIRLLFQNASVKLYKGSKTTYGDWATQHGFIWAEGSKIPEAWLKEKGNKK